MLKFFVNLSYIFLLAMHIGMHLCLNFEAESETTKGTNFKLVCSVDQSRFTGQVISFLKDGSSKSTCDNANNCLPFSSDSGRYQYFSNASSVTVEISVANHLTDSGNWKCRLGLIEEQDYELVVKTIPTFTNFTQTIPDSNSSESVENVKLSGRSYCIFPPPSVNLNFRVTGSFQLLQKIPDTFINKRNETSSCEPYEFDVEVSNFTVELMGKTNVFFEMQFGDYKTSDVVGPFSFKENKSSNDEDKDGIIIGSVIAVVGITTGAALIVYIYKKYKKEEQSKIDPQSREDPKVKELIKELLDWINKVLADCEITVKDIEKDLSDGEILQMLIEKLAGEKVKVPQSERDQKQKLQIILAFINRILQKSSPRTQIKWSVDSVNTKNLVAILHLLVALAKHYRAPIRLPENVSVNLVVVTKQCGKLDTSSIVAEVINPVDEDVETRFG